MQPMTLAAPNPSLARRVLLTLAVLSLVFTGWVNVAPQAQAVPSLSSGWTQPLDSMSGLSAGFLANDCGHPGYGSYIPGEYHIANDYGRSAGTAVYSIGAGTVVAKQSGWPGSAVFVRHTAPDGTQFLSVYGHINSGLAVNNTVAAGQQIGTVYSNHLHFGIREATVPAGSNNGNMPCSSWPNTNGYRDPLPFLAAHPITPPPPPPPPADQDGDGTPDSTDVMPRVAGTSMNRGAPVESSRLTGDFNGDGHQDIAAFYNYGGDRTRLFVFPGPGVDQPFSAWDSGPGNWNWERMKPVVADFTGDGKTDIAAFYNYGGGTTKLWLFVANGSGFNNPVVKWNSGPGNWEWERIQQVSGDFTSDSRPDIAVFYDYGGDRTKLFVFPGDGSGFLPPATTWDSGPGNWNWSHARPSSGDFNGDGATDIMAFYDYGGDRTKLWLFPGSSSGWGSPVAVWDSGSGNWDWSRAKPVVADFTGDGKTDIAAFYNYGGDRTRLFVFPGASSGIGQYFSAWDSGPGSWDWNRIKPVAGDFNSDGHPDVAAFYGYGGATTRLFSFSGTSSGLGAPVVKWDSGPGNWDWNRVLTP